MKLSIVTPVYYNEANIPHTYPRLTSVAKRIAGTSYELIFVDDGSRDGSLEVLRALQQKDPHIVILKLSRNFGSFNAIQAGLSVAKGNAVGIISADLQDPPELFEEMYEHWKMGKKIVMATREGRRDPLMSRVFACLFYAIIRRFALPQMPRGGFDFVLIDKQIVSLILRINERHASLMALITWLGFPNFTITYTRQERKHGVSRWTFMKKFNLFIDTFTAFSFFPIRLISFLGLILSLTSFAYAMFILYLRIANGINVEGWAALAIMILFISGFQLLSLGIIGEYLWRNFDQSKQRPNYIIEEIYRS